MIIDKNDAIESLRSKVRECEFMIDCEQAVQNHLQPDMDKFNKREPYDYSRVRQWLASRDLIKGWREDIATFDLAIKALNQ